MTPETLRDQIRWAEVRLKSVRRMRQAALAEAASLGAQAAELVEELKYAGELLEDLEAGS